MTNLTYLPKVHVASPTPVQRNSKKSQEMRNKQKRFPWSEEPSATTVIIPILCVCEKEAFPFPLLQQTSLYTDN